jgi:hypothetical protein
MSAMLTCKYKPSKTMVGPFPVAAVSDYVRAKLVATEKVPITLHEVNDEGEERYAVLAPRGKELRVLCVGCFKPNVSLFDNSRCKNVSSYCQHWDMNAKLNLCRHECKSVSPNTLTECLDRVETSIVHDDAEMEADGVDLTDVDTEHLVHELLKHKKDFEFISAVTRLIQPPGNKCPRTTRTC